MITFQHVPKIESPPHLTNTTFDKKARGLTHELILQNIRLHGEFLSF